MYAPHFAESISSHLSTTLSAQMSSQSRASAGAGCPSINTVAAVASNSFFRIVPSLL
jgi:hypothetical protein